MESWIVLALIAPFFWALANFIDKYVLEKHTIGTIDFVFFSSITSWVFVPVMILLFGVPVFDAAVIIPMLTGMGWIYSYGFYGKALEEGETSSIVILFKLVPVITAILGFIFLGQILSVDELIAFMVVLTGAVIVSVDRKKGWVMKGFSMTMIAVFLWAVVTLVTDYGLTKMAFWDYVIWEHVGAAFAGLTLFLVPSMRKEVIQGLKESRLAKYGWFGLNNFFDFLAQLIIKKALVLAPSAALVTVVLQSQSVYAILIGVCLTLLMPSIIKEDISKKTLLKKAVGVAVMLTGVYMLLV